MTVPLTSFDVPIDSQIIDENGQLVPAYRDYFSKLSAALTKLRDAATAMDTLAASPTNAEIATAWNEFRTTLQEIV